MPRGAERYRALLGELQKSLTAGVERSRAALQDVIGQSVKLEPDDSGKFLWAEVGIKTTPMLSRASGSEIMVAGAGFAIAASPLSYVGRLRLPRHDPAPLRGYADSKLVHQTNKKGRPLGDPLCW